MIYSIIIILIIVGIKAIFSAGDTSFTYINRAEIKQNKYSRIPVYENNEIIGIITMEDILEKLVGKIFDEDDIK